MITTQAALDRIYHSNGLKKCDIPIHRKTLKDLIERKILEIRSFKSENNETESRYVLTSIGVQLVESKIKSENILKLRVNKNMLDQKDICDNMQGTFKWKMKKIKN